MGRLPAAAAVSIGNHLSAVGQSPTRRHNAIIDWESLNNEEVLIWPATWELETSTPTVIL
jgi:hypothetical protein